MALTRVPSVPVLKLQLGLYAAWTTREPVPVPGAGAVGRVRFFLAVRNVRSYVYNVNWGSGGVLRKLGSKSSLFVRPSDFNDGRPGPGVTTIGADALAACGIAVANMDWKRKKDAASV